MIETLPLLVSERQAPAPDHAPLLEQLAMLRRENAALGAENAALRRGPSCGKRTRAALPAGVPRRPFGPRLTAVIALLSGRYRLSRREVRQLLQDLWQVRLSLGAVLRQEQAQSAALAPIVEAARAAVQHAAVVNMDETGWREAQQRAWLWTVVAGTLTVVPV